MVEKLVQALTVEKALHGLVNNAGAVWAAPIDDYRVRPQICPDQSLTYACQDTTFI